MDGGRSREDTVLDAERSSLEAEGLEKDSDRAALLFILDTRGTRESVIGKARNAVIERSRSNASRSVSPWQLHWQRYGYTYRSFIDRNPGRNVSVVRLKKISRNPWKSVVSPAVSFFAQCSRRNGSFRGATAERILKVGIESQDCCVKQLDSRSRGFSFLRFKTSECTNKYSSVAAIRLAILRL